MYKNGMGPLPWKEQHLDGSARLGMQKMDKGLTGTMQAEGTGFTGVQTQHGQKSYELSNHLGNVMAVISDRGVVQSAQDYYPFGMSMPGRSTDAKHRYGFNGKETDPETGIQDYGMRWYLPNIARFPSVDPLTAKYPFYTPYQFAGNMPIQFIDLDGCEPADPESKWTPRPEYDDKNGNGGNHYSTPDGHYVHKQGETYNWAKVGDQQWNPDANWKPTDYIDKRPVGIPAQTIDNKWVTEFHAHTRSMAPMLNYATRVCESAAYTTVFFALPELIMGEVLATEVLVVQPRQYYLKGDKKNHWTLTPNVPGLESFERLFASVTKKGKKLEVEVPIYYKQGSRGGGNATRDFLSVIEEIEIEANTFQTQIKFTGVETGTVKAYQKLGQQHGFNVEVEHVFSNIYDVIWHY